MPERSTISGIFWLLVAVVFVVGYFVPALVANLRWQRKRKVILALNFLFGWTVVLLAVGPK